MKFLNKALLYREWKTSWWVIPILFLFTAFITTLSFLSVISSATYYPKYSNYRLIQLDAISTYYSQFSPERIILVAFLSAILLQFILMYHDRKYEVSMMNFSMPFKREDIIKNKIFFAIFIICIVNIIDFIINSLIYFSNYKILTQLAGRGVKYEPIFQFHVMSIALTIAIFTLFILVQSLFGDAIFGSVVGIGFITAPLVLTSLVFEFMKINGIGLNLGSNLEMRSNDFIQGFYMRFINYNPIGHQLKNIYYETYKINMSSSILVCMIAAIIFSVIAMAIFKHNEADKSGGFIIFDKLEVIFNLIVSVVVGMLSSIIIYQMMEGSRELPAVIVDGIFIIASIIIYLVIKKILQIKKVKA